MLVLTRKLGEEVLINTGDKEIKVMLVQIKGKQARIGIKAPQDVKISRSELLKDNNQAEEINEVK